VLVRQVLGAIAQFEKASLVAKLKAARDRKIAAGIKCGGRKSFAERDPDMVAEAKRMHRRERKSLREIARELAGRGHVDRNGRPYSAQSVANMVAGR
jgi:DNA invertase Pin-like site-specific DNA recombinase